MTTMRSSSGKHLERVAGDQLRVLECELRGQQRLGNATRLVHGVQAEVTREVGEEVEAPVGQLRLDMKPRREQRLDAARGEARFRVDGHGAEPTGRTRGRRSRLDGCASYRGAPSPSSSPTSRGRRGCSTSSARRGTRRRWPSTVASCAKRSRARRGRGGHAGRRVLRRVRDGAGRARGGRPRRRRRFALPVRMGIHTGSAHAGEEGYVGMDVNRAARIAAAGHGGQVLVSAATRGACRWLQPPSTSASTASRTSAPMAVFQLGESKFPPLKTISNTNLPRPASSFVGRSGSSRRSLARIESGRAPADADRPGWCGKDAAGARSSRRARSRIHGGRVLGGARRPSRSDARDRDGRPDARCARRARRAHRRTRTVASARQLRAGDRGRPRARRAPRELPQPDSARHEPRALARPRRGRVSGPAARRSRGSQLFCARRARLDPSDDIRELCRAWTRCRWRSSSQPRGRRRSRRRRSSTASRSALDLLSGGRDADPRQRTLRATIEWSHEPPARAGAAALRRASPCFAGGCDARSRRGGLRTPTSTSSSRSSRRASCAIRSERFWMLETIREYARERLVRARRGERRRAAARRVLQAVRGVARSSPSRPTVRKLCALRARDGRAEQPSRRHRLGRHRDGRSSFALRIAVPRTVLGEPQSPSSGRARRALGSATGSRRSGADVRCSAAR